MPLAEFLMSWSAKALSKVFILISVYEVLKLTRSHLNNPVPNDLLASEVSQCVEN